MSFMDEYGRCAICARRAAFKTYFGEKLCTFHIHQLNVRVTTVEIKELVERLSELAQESSHARRSIRSAIKKHELMVNY